MASAWMVEAVFHHGSLTTMAAITSYFSYPVVVRPRDRAVSWSPSLRPRTFLPAVAGTMAAGGLSRGCRAAQAARRRTSQTVAAMSSTDSASSQPPSIHWNGQNRLPGW